MRLRVIAGIVVMMVAHVVAARSASAAVVRTFGVFDVHFYGSGESDVGYTSNSSWTDEQIADVGSSLLAWDAALEGVPSRQLVVKLFWMDHDGSTAPRPWPPGASHILLLDFDSPLGRLPFGFGSAAPTDLEVMAAPGDSGGGRFADLGSEPALVGVSDYRWGVTAMADSSYGNATGAARVSSHYDWIYERIAAAYVVPEPSACAIFIGLHVLGPVGRGSRRRNRTVES